MGFSIPAQVKLLWEYAGQQSIKIATTFIDAETAKCAGRTAFRKTLRSLEDHPNVGIVLAEKTDRLYRNSKDCVHLDFEELGPKIPIW